MYQKAVVNVVTKSTTKEKCWQVIGYPSWHPKSNKFPQKKADRSQPARGRGKGGSHGTLAANNVEVRTKNTEDITLTAHQIEQLKQMLNLLPSSQQSCGAETDAELDTNFAGMILCTHAGLHNSEWILDSELQTI